VIVADASVVIDYLLGTGSDAADRMATAFEREQIVVPHLLDVEVGQVMRRLARAGELSGELALRRLAELAELPFGRFPHLLLLSRAFDFRHNVSMYDAVYLALAEMLEVPLLTADAGLRFVPGCRAEVLFVPASR
jgi:predicted nucleic acid-binding protein